MKRSPLVSVIVPCYNVEKYLTSCINSIIHQTYNNLEILLVDDGSPDSCGDICDNFATYDDRIRVIHKQNGGVSDARNAALDIANGEYITCVDGDDTISDDYVETMLELVNKYDCQIAMANFAMDYDGRYVLNNKRPIETVMSTSKALDCLFYQNGFDDYPWCKLYHKSLFEGIRYPKDIIYEDTYITYQLFMKCKTLAYTSKQVYRYMIRSDSYEGSPFSKLKLDSALMVFQLLENELNGRLKSHKRSIACRILSLACHLLLKCPSCYDNKDVLWDIIKKYRRIVIFDSAARKQAKIAGLLSYCGVATMKKMFALVDKRRH